jgi:hypothetical protein
MAKPRPTPAVVEPREARVQALMDELRPQVDALLRQLVERVVDGPEDAELGAIAYELRDASQHLGPTVQQAGLARRKKRGTSGAAWTARDAPTSPRSTRISGGGSSPCKAKGS